MSTAEERARERRKKKLQQGSAERLDYILGHRDNPNPEPKTEAQLQQEQEQEQEQEHEGRINGGRPAMGARAARRADVYREHGPMWAIWKLLRKVVFVLVVLAAWNATRGKKLCFVDGWSVALIVPAPSAPTRGALDGLRLAPGDVVVVVDPTITDPLMKKKPFVSARVVEMSLGPDSTPRYAVFPLSGRGAASTKPFWVGRNGVAGTVIFTTNPKFWWPWK